MKLSVLTYFTHNKLVNQTGIAANTGTGYYY